MTTTDRKTMENQAATLIKNINSRYESNVTSSIMTLHGGEPSRVSSWALEEMLDDLISIENDSD